MGMDMREIIQKKYAVLDIENIGMLARDTPRNLVQDSEAYYNFQLAAAADAICGHTPAYKFILLCGPSASGKTTTAHKLKKQLMLHKVSAQVVSMDNFFTGMESYPILPDGSRDMESIQAIDLNLLNRCFEELLAKGESDFPLFDFAAQTQRLGVHHVELADNAVIIMEGIHALNPAVLQGISRDAIFRLYVSVRTKFTSGGETVLEPKDIRLIRRMVRDYNFRNYMPLQTLSYWKHVVNGERANIDLYRDDVDLKMDSTIDYEVCVWHNLLHSLLESSDLADYMAYPELKKIFAALERFPEMDYGMIPKDSLLREFIGYKA